MKAGEGHAGRREEQAGGVRCGDVVRDEEEMQISGRVIYDLILCSPCLL